MTNYYINEAILSFSGNISQDSTKIKTILWVGKFP